MKLDTKAFRYLSPEDWRVLTAVEIGTKNHNVVPTPLIASLSSLRGGQNSANRSISVLAKAGLIAKVKNAKYDGYRLTYGGLDYLALHAHTKGGSIIHLGSQMGTGKESDIYLVTSPAVDAETVRDVENERPKDGSTRGGRSIQGVVEGDTVGKPVQSILKLHRLGRISFRSLTRNRDYHGGRQHASWQYLSRLSAQKEFTAMKALYDAGFPVPRPIAWNRHTVVMSLIPGMPLRQVGIEAFGGVIVKELDASSEEQSKEDETVKQDRDQRIADLYAACMELALRLAEYGCIHGDFNEFNILIENVPELLENQEDEDLLHHESQPQLSHNQEETLPLIPHLIDFPQITSLSHPQAKHYFDRDVDCIKTFFNRKYNFVSMEPGPTIEDAMNRLEMGEKRRVEQRDQSDGNSKPTSKRLDVQIAAMGFSKKMARDLEVYFEETADVREGEDLDDDGQKDEKFTVLDEDEAGYVDETEANEGRSVGLPFTDYEIADEASAAIDRDDNAVDRDGSIERTGSVSVEQAPESSVELIGNKELQLTENNLRTLNSLQPRHQNLLSSKMATVSLDNNPQKLKTKPKAAAGWSI